MGQIVLFLIKNRNLLLFLALTIIGVVFTVQSHTYHSHVIFNSSNRIAGTILETKSEIGSYFHLRERNHELLEENSMLRSQLLAYTDTAPGQSFSRTYNDSLPYKFIPAKVIKNDYANHDNYITLNAGKAQGITSNMGVIGTKGVIGITDAVSKNYTRVISVLSHTVSINARLGNTDIIGSLQWDGKNPYTTELVDVPRLAKIKTGDTIYTGKQSTLFPPDIIIGTVQQVRRKKNSGRFDIDVRLINDMTNLGMAYAVESREAEAIRAIDTLQADE